MGSFFKKIWLFVAASATVLSIMSARDLFYKEKGAEISVQNVAENSTSHSFIDSPVQIINIFNNNAQISNQKNEIQESIDTEYFFGKEPNKVLDIAKKEAWNELKIALTKVDELCLQAFIEEEQKAAIKDVIQLYKKMQENSFYIQDLTLQQQHIKQQIEDSQSIRIGSCIK